MDGDCTGTRTTETAQRFRSAVERTFADFARMPEMGSVRQLRDARHAEFAFGCSGNSDYWLAYYPHRCGVAIERLFHAKQDYNGIMQ
jgi:plasmid stabilization system protein ParE